MFFYISRCLSTGNALGNRIKIFCNRLLITFALGTVTVIVVQALSA